MRMNAPGYGFLVALACLAGVARAASFDCAVAATPVERMICGDVILSQGDEDLAKAYARALARATQPGTLRDAQRRWLAKDRNRCADLACLRMSYARRLEALGAAQGALAPLDPDVALCKRVAEHARWGILDKLRVPRSGEQPLSMLGDVEGDPDIGTHMVDFWELDLDGDSVTDRLAIDVQGTMHAGVAYARSGKPGSAVVKLESNDIDQRVLKIGGKAYMLSDDGLAYSPWTLWRLHAQEGLVPVCTVVPRREQRVKLTAGWGHAACRAAQDDMLEQVEFDAALSTASLPGERRFRAMSLTGGVVQVDIDNDGTDEHVFSVTFDSGAGRGCSAGYLAVADEEGHQVPDTWLNQQLLGGIGLGCDSVLDIATHEGVAYVDARSRTGDRTLYRIDSQRVTNVCEFRAVPGYDVVGDSPSPPRSGQDRRTCRPCTPQTPPATWPPARCRWPHNQVAGSPPR